MAASPSSRVSSRRASRSGSGPPSARSTRGRRPESARARTSSGPSKRKALRRRWVALLSVLTVLALGYVLLFTGLFGVRSVRVVGTNTVPVAQVREVASVEQGQPLLRVDTDAVRTRVMTVRAFSSVEVSRSWPSTIVISVTERVPVAVVDTGEGFRFVDGSGVVFRTVPTKPPGLPLLRLPRVGPDNPVVRAATAVLAALPKQLAERVVAVSADTPNSVRLELADGTKVVWGSAEQSARKAKVLAALLTRPGSVYDVSSPELPTVS